MYYPERTPERTHEQRLIALNKANQVRVKRAKFKREVKAGQIVVYAYLITPPAWIETMKLMDLLTAIPQLGRVKANTVLVKTNLSPSKTIGAMSPRQRYELVAFLRHR